VRFFFYITSVHNADKFLADFVIFVASFRLLFLLPFSLTHTHSLSLSLSLSLSQPSPLVTFVRVATRQD